MNSSSPVPVPSVRTFPLRTLGLAVLLVAALVAAYWVSLLGEFLWDDDLHITANPTIIGPLGLKEIWTTARANYFPLVLTNFWVQHALWGLNPFGYHLVTLACHALAALLLWRVLSLLRVPGAWLGAALWALHPVQVESVAWICELKNTQSAVFFLVAIWAWTRWLGVGQVSDLPSAAPRASAGKSRPRPTSKRFYALALACALLAILSKPSTVMLPIVLALIGWWRFDRFAWRDLRALAPFFALSAMAAGWTIWEQRVNSGASGDEWSQTWPERLVIAGRVGWFYLGKLIWPADLMFIYPRWKIEAGRLLAFAPLAGAVGGLALLWWRRVGALRPIFVTAVFFAALLFPVMGFFNVFFFRYSFVGDHFQYLASMGPLALAGAGLAWAGGRIEAPWTRFRPIVPAVLVMALGVLSWRAARDYVSSEALWRAALAHNPGAFMAWANLGDVMVRQGRHEEAIASFRHALRLRPDDPPVHNDLGNELVAIGQPEAAIPILERALRLKPGYVEVHNNLGNALSRLGRSDEALAHYASAVRLKPTHAEAQDNLGCELVVRDRVVDAIPYFEEAVLLRPQSVKFRRDLAMALARSRRFREAVGHFEQLIRLEPKSSGAHAMWGQALGQLGRWDEALARFQAGLVLAPEDADLRASAGVALGTLGKFAEAAAELGQAVRLRPDSAEARENLGQILRALGRNLEAADHLDEAARLRLKASRPNP